ncbi:hypothetical protein HY484_04275 [Candidatus Woesearchaeota archaeon]|nr:hypothetical protein [Candidatus Woesearchaeota archaeon]
MIKTNKTKTIARTTKKNKSLDISSRLIAAPRILIRSMPALITQIFFQIINQSIVSHHKTAWKIAPFFIDINCNKTNTKIRYNHHVLKKKHQRNNGNNCNNP